MDEWWIYLRCTDCGEWVSRKDEKLLCDCASVDLMDETFTPNIWIWYTDPDEFISDYP